MLIKKIRKQGRVKVITIPKNDDLQIGDFVEIIKVKSVSVEEAK